MMHPLKQLLGDPFYDLLEACAQEACASVRFLPQLLESGRGNLQSVVLSRQKTQRIAAEIAERLSKTTMACLRKEDIEAVAQALCRIPESVERFARRISISRDGLPEASVLLGMAILVGKKADILVSMVSQLRVFNSVPTTRELQAKLQEMQREADKLDQTLLGHVYDRDADVVNVVMTKDLFEHMQAIVDQFCEAAQVVNEVALKYD